MRAFGLLRCVVALGATVSCSGGAPFDTGLEGHMMRSPTSPVCAPTLGCTAPLAADFSVWHTGLLVARFQSDSAGAFFVRLPAGIYGIVPDSSAPVVPGQVKTVTVKSESLTSVVLDFDTGIR
ncbi:MAG TPA: hypothetical protein VFP39_07000 [Gemmatimonadales bacterium]|nr:hypothetical protein [Gemmatimonadales bacterium]